MQYKIESIAFQFLFSFLVGNLSKFIMYLFYYYEDWDVIGLLLGIIVLFLFTKNRFFSYLCAGIGIMSYEVWVEQLGLSVFPHTDTEIVGKIKGVAAYLFFAIILHFVLLFITYLKKRYIMQGTNKHL